MDHTPRYHQPFTLAQAVLFDVSVINEEISRLQNSLHHLRETQTMLHEHMESTSPVDPQIEEAIEENKLVIGSQEERVLILKMALLQKGASSSSHYDQTPVSHPEEATRALPTTMVNTEHNDAAGIYL